MAQFIEMEHKETGGKALVTERALKQVWKAKGWTKVTKSTKKQASKKETT